MRRKSLLAKWIIFASVLPASVGGEPPSECAVAPQATDVTTVFEFDPSTARYPEGIAIARGGDIYLAIQPTGEIVRLNGDGGFSTIADLNQGGGFMLGLAIDPQGSLYAALDSFDPATHGVWRIDKHGGATLIAPMPISTLPNEIAFDLTGNMYVTDTFGGAIWKLSKSGDFELWLSSSLLEGTGVLFGVNAGANGIVFVRESRGEEANRGTSGVLYVTNTDRGTIVRVPILRDGSAGVPTVFAEDQALASADGIEADIKGNLYVAVNLQNTVVRVDRCGQTEVVIEGLDRPASLAFGTARGEQRLLYVTNFGFVTGEHLIRGEFQTRGFPVP